MQPTEKLTSIAGAPSEKNSLLAAIRAIRARVKSTLQLLRRGANNSAPQVPVSPALKIARYSLVLMDADGQVVWTGEWDSGGVFEFRPRQRLWVFCGFTNHSTRQTEISEYEVELMGEDGSIVERFNNSFGDSLIIPPGETTQFPAEWRM